ncbi:hypothetical protein E4U47_005175 [Claviceps purpurea]|nr:hypothetical protein E4U10_004601 [Claviceps purpurea]KAG6245795.1 hypothetical protein E4U23_005041 [Claviceps purpurea]KAG6267644.1 hypothetical protein E4U47_005175 [Claviceps purpurea]
MRFTLFLGLSAAVSALPLDGSDKSLLSDLTPGGLKLPLYKLGDWVEEEVEEGIEGIEDILERSPLPDIDKVVVNVAN